MNSGEYILKVVQFKGKYNANASEELFKEVEDKINEYYLSGRLNELVKLEISERNKPDINEMDERGLEVEEIVW
jgi:hypothetical protein